MFGRRFRVAGLFGISVYVDISWLFLAALITWSLARNVFPIDYPGLAERTYWMMGAAGAIGLFFSILSHEVAHSLVAKRHGIAIRGITLFIFGGVAEMEDEPPSARAEFWMAAAGPAWSLVLAGLLYAASIASNTGGGEGDLGAVHGTLAYLALMNAVLAGFNMLPAFPLDGGRVFRAAIWHLRQSYAAATRLAGGVGAWFGLGFMIVGAVAALAGGNLVGGIWWFVIGLFLRGAAHAELARLEASLALGGITVGRFMTRDPTVVPADTSIAHFIDDFVYRYFHDCFPVVDGGVIGMVGLRQLERVPAAQWPTTPVSAIMIRADRNSTIEARAGAVRALALMQKTGLSRLLVTERGALTGIVTLKDLLQAVEIAAQLGALRGA